MNKVLLYFLISINFSTLIYADEEINISMEKLKKIFEKNCHQTIESNFSIVNNSTNNNSCNFTYVNKSLRKDNKEIKRLSNKIKESKSEVEKLKKIIYKKQQSKNTNLNSKILKENRKKVQKHSKLISKYNEEIKQLHKKNSEFKEILNLTKEELNYSFSVNQENQNILKKWSVEVNQNINEITDINREISYFENNLKELNIKIDALSKKQSNQIKKNERSIEKQRNQIGENKNYIKKHESYINKYINSINNHYLGVEIKTAIDGSLFGAIEYEGYNFDNKFYLFSKISGGHLNDTTNYSTLSGMPKEKKEQTKNIYGLDIGIRKLIDYKLTRRIMPYTSLSGGYILGDEKTMTGTVALGLEYSYKSDKVLLEIGEQYFNSISQRDISFNSLGVSENKIEENSDFKTFISLKYLWRW